jgi:hypothetical protein
MTGGNIHRFDTTTCPEDCPYELITNCQRTPPAFQCRYPAVLSYEPAFTHTDSGCIQYQAQMTGYAKPSRMGDPLSIAQDNIRDSDNLLKRLYQSRDLPER